MSEVIFDKESQLKKIQEYVLDFEDLLYVYDLKGVGAGFIGITNKRLIFFDKSFFSKKKVIVSIEFSKIAIVQARDENAIFKGFFSSSELEITAISGQTWEFEFRGSEKAINVYKEIIKHTLSDKV